MPQSIKDKFLSLKSLCDSFSTSAEPLGGGFSSLVVDMKDGTVTKFYQQNTYTIERNRRSLLNEAHLLKAFNGRVGQFLAPTLTADPVIFEEGTPIAAAFIGSITMTKLEGRTLPWGELSKHTTEQATAYMQQVGSAIATIQNLAEKYNLHYTSTLNTHPINAPWITDPEMMHIIDMCNQWFEQNQQPGFVHGDIAGRNILVDKNNNIVGLLDFSFSGIHSNGMADFLDIVGDYLPAATEEYENTSSRKLNNHLVEMTQIQGLSSYISTLVDAVGQEKELAACKTDLEKWVQSFTKDLALQ